MANKDQDKLAMLKEYSLASIKNDLVLKASYDLSSNESKLLMYLIATIDSKNASDFELRTVKVKDIEKAFSKEEKKWGSFYKRLDFMCGSIMSKPIKIPQDFLLDGKKVELHEYIHWFQKIRPIYDEDGEVAVQFYFHDDVKPFLISLKRRFVQVDVKKEYFRFTGKHTLHLYPAFKGARDEEKSRYPNSKKTTLVYGIDEFKAKLRIENKYNQFGNFRLRVLDPMVEEINQKSSVINVFYDFIKGGRGGKITAIEFAITDVVHVEPKKKVKEKELENYVPSKEDIEKLSFSQLRAYEILTKFGVYEGIAYKQIIPTIKGANMGGYEDVFCEQAIKLFKQKEKPKKDKKTSVAVFVNWWTDKKVFDIAGDVFFQISDKVHAYKKQMGQERMDNREVAKKMTAGEFEKWYKEQQAKQEQD